MVTEINNNAKKYINDIRVKCERIKPLVAINCITYNHEKYLRDALDGFIMQKADFPIVAIVHDDASTDGTATILREYAEKYPDIILPIYETENQYSKRNGALRQIMHEARNATGAKYIAYCEGDDFWTDPLKLQKQVDYLESHPDYSLCVTNINILDNKGTCHPSIYNTTDDADLSIKDIILKGGLYIGTASIVTRALLLNQKPKAMNNLHVGDYPLQIYMASLGKVRNLNDVTCVYRSMAEGSWTTTLRENSKYQSKRLQFIENELSLLDTMNKVTNYRFRKYFELRSAKFRYIHMLSFDRNGARKIFFKHPLFIYKNFHLISILYICLPPSVFETLRNIKKIING